MLKLVCFFCGINALSGGWTFTGLVLVWIALCEDFKD